MSNKHKLLLKISRPEISSGLKKLLELLEEDVEIRKKFIFDPAGVIAISFSDSLGKLSIDKIDEANRLIFSILSNDQFRSWAEEYNEEMSKTFSLRDPDCLDKRKIRKDLAEAILKYGDPDLIDALLGPRERSEALTTIDIQSRADTVVYVETAVAAIAVAIVIVLVTAVDATPRAPDLEKNMRISKLSAPDLRAISEQLIDNLPNIKKIL